MTAHQQSFWDRVDWHLDDLDTPPAIRRKIEEKLLATVKRPTARELQELQVAREDYHRSMRAGL